MIYLSRFKINQASQLLRQGQLIAYPTEAIYGLGCDPLNEFSVMQLLTLKQRPVEKGLILIAASIQQLQPYLLLETPGLIDKALATWPGPSTWVIPAQSWVPKWLTGSHNTLAVRVTAHPLASALCKRFAGPMVSTSANISNQQPAQSPYQLSKTFGSQTPYIIKGSNTGLFGATPIFDLVTGKQLR